MAGHTPWRKLRHKSLGGKSLEELTPEERADYEERLRRRVEVHCQLCRDGRFVCKEHPDRPWPHDDCAGPGIPCPSCQTAGERPELPDGWRRVEPGEHAGRIEFAEDDKTREIQPLLDALYEHVLYDEEPSFFVSDEATIYDLCGTTVEELIQRCSEYYRTAVTREDLKKPLYVLLPELERQRTIRH